MSAIFGFIGGLLASIVVPGGRKVLTPMVFRRKLCVGNISSFVRNGVLQCWHIPVEVKASKWEFFVTDIKVMAIIDYIEKDGYSQSYFAPWIEQGIGPVVKTLQIGGIVESIIVATVVGKQLLPLGGSTGKLFKDDQDITLELSCGQTTLGKWCYEKAIVGGGMQEVSPIKIRKESKSLGKRIQSKLPIPNITKKDFHRILDKASKPIKKSGKEKS